MKAKRVSAREIMEGVLGFKDMAGDGLVGCAYRLREEFAAVMGRKATAADVRDAAEGLRALALALEFTTKLGPGNTPAQSVAGDPEV